MIPQKYLTADSLFKELTHINWKGSKGSIFFSIVGTTVKITHTDIIGSVLQDWVKNYIYNQKYILSRTIKFTRISGLFSINS